MLLGQVHYRTWEERDPHDARLAATALDMVLRGVPATGWVFALSDLTDANASGWTKGVAVFSMVPILGGTLREAWAVAAFSGAAEGFEAIGSTGKVGEQALKALGGEPQAYFPTSQGGRFVDQLVDGIAHESKVGYKSLTPTIARQIAKDAELIGTSQIDGATWHFFQSPVTGLAGPSGPLREALEAAGIVVEIH
jgi:hypothetical protein